MAYKRIEKIRLSDYSDFLNPRPRESFKNMFGHVLIIGGDYGYSGAVHMAAEAALRIGAGLVSVATQPEHAFILNSTRPEIMCHGIKKVDDLKPLLAKATVVVIGPGLGQSRWSKNIAAIVFKSKKPMVVDADALNILAMKNEKHSHWILTPHPGEAARLLKCTTEVIQQDRLTAAKLLQKKCGGVIILKGARTIVDGQDAIPAVCTAGNPGMASAGMGDILSGVIGGLLAQQLPLIKAAKLGVLLHAAAGDLAAKQGERGMIATDLLPYLRLLVNP